MSLLAIDQGNSRTKFGLFRAGALLRTWVTGTDKQAGAATLLHALRHDPEMTPGTPIGLCSVVPELLPAWEQAAHALDSPLTIFTGNSPTPLRNAYETPETLGPDRLLAAVAAVDRAGAPVIPISAGTAFVVDAVSADRVYLGGMIAPGITPISEALSVAASALWPPGWHEPEHAIGATSEEALRHGLFYLSIGGLRAMVDAVRRELGVAAPLVLTGGWAQRVAPHLDGVALLDEYLVLHGIALALA